MNLTITLQTPGLADGIYKVKKRGALAASLYWADQNGALEGWSSIAYIPISPYGQGEFRFTGGRAVPPEATHVLARVIMKDFVGNEEYLTPIPDGYRSKVCQNGKVFQDGKTFQDAGTLPCSFAFQDEIKLCAMSDLHLSGRDGRLRWALHWADGADALLLAGDLVNDGLPNQFKLIDECLENTLSGVPVFAVGGNHDQPLKPLPHIVDGINTFPLFRETLRRRSERLGICWEQDDSGAYSVRLKETEIIGLEAVTHGRRFVFPQDRQLHFLERRLEECGAQWRIIVCHAPLLLHNPQRKPGENSTPYMGGDNRLQKILDAHRNIIFLSGHTHFSPNDLQGCVEYDQVGNRIYINDGSVCPTQIRREEALIPEEWVSGIFTEIRIHGKHVELLSRSVDRGVKFPRGCYRFG